MSTILLLCSQCDSLAAKICEKTIMQMDKAGANWADVKIASTICCALVKIVAICVCGFLAWKLLEYIAKGIAGLFRRTWDVNDREKKKQADLLTKLLDFKKELAFPYDKNKDGKNEKKEYDSDKSDNYIQLLNSLLGLLEKKNETEKT